jgi:elongator complex protein 3
LIEAGVKKSHLRELVMKELRSGGTPCRCIRCREIGHLPSGKVTPLEGEAELTATTYCASKGSEIFLAYEIPSTDSLVGYARLRFPSDPKAEAALLRELHIYGQMAPIDGKSGAHWQHKGFGEKLLKESEARAREVGYSELWVTSGVGARNYYRRLGYELQGPYMTKRLHE